MEIPAIAFSSTIEEKNIYLFSSDKLNTSVPHHFICLKKLAGDVVILSCCSSKYETAYNFIKLKKIPETTLVTIPAKTEGTEFTKHTYVNCNEYFELSISALEKMFLAGKIKATGALPNLYYEQIISGIKESPLIDQELKDELS